jgi:hypothetical protein
MAMYWIYCGLVFIIAATYIKIKSKISKIYPCIFKSADSADYQLIYEELLSTLLSMIDYILNST